MTDAEKLTTLQSLLANDVAAPDSTALSAYLTIAGLEIINWRYSQSSETVSAVPTEYEMTQIYAVLAGLSTSGAEGEVSHSENGTSRTFKYADMIDYIRAHVRPICKVV